MFERKGSKIRKKFSVRHGVEQGKRPFDYVDGRDFNMTDFFYIEYVEGCGRRDFPYAEKAGNEHDQGESQGHGSAHDVENTLAADALFLNRFRPDRGRA